MIVVFPHLNNNKAKEKNIDNSREKFERERYKKSDYVGKINLIRRFVDFWHTERHTIKSTTYPLAPTMIQRRKENRNKN